MMLVSQPESVLGDSIFRRPRQQKPFTDEAVATTPFSVSVSTSETPPVDAAKLALARTTARNTPDDALEPAAA